MKKFFIYILDSFKNWFISYRDMKILQKTIYWFCLIGIIIVAGILFSFHKLLPLILVGIYLFIIIKILLNNRWWKNIFTWNIFIFGAKGTGKDLSMQIGTYLNRKSQVFISNMDYGYGTILLDTFADVMDIGNTHENLVTGDINVIEKKPFYEGKNMLISDGSIYFPSHEDTLLKRKFPSFPLFYGISRHLYDMPIVVNTQVNGRLWKSLREQVQDGYIEALGTKGFSFLWNSIPILRNYVKVNLRFYQKEDSAVMGLLPFKKVAFLNKGLDNVYLTSGGATKEQYEATHGKIYDRSIVMKKKYIKYDSRHFHSLIFGYESESK